MKTWRILLSLGLFTAVVEAAPKKISFNRDVRAILSENCYTCHGPDAAARKAKLRLDVREAAVAETKNGSFAIKPGDVEESELVYRIFAEDPDEVMPPKESKLALTAEQKAILKQWIAEGAEYEPHWAYVKPKREALPAVKDAKWGRNDVDRFILAQLERRGWKPSLEADKHALIRRVSLDLTGLPPTPDEVKAFIADKSPEAYGKLVDRLLAKTAYGEHWARQWLDLARYADSTGYADDQPRTIWGYRDWVIRALNGNMPFDQFTREQLAGDLLHQPTNDQLVATAFHRNTQTNNEGGTADEEFRNVAVVDRVNTTMQVWMGTTMACAQCHDHKYDPISQVEYYRLFAFFNNADEPRIDAPTREVQFQRAAIDEKIKQVEASLSGLAKEDAKRKSIEDSLAKLKKTRPKAATTMVMARRKEPRTTRRFIQGDFTRPAEEVQAGTPGVLHRLAKRDGDRLGFARWVADTNNPLLARVAVNRMWQHLFGQGIVQTDNDFGSQGIPPTHPRLLDWLAVEFMENGWSQKELHRLLVTSATYRQASSRRADVDRIDPANKWLARQARFRLDAELVRDVALAASGMLSARMGGPGVFPPQPEGCMDLGQHRKTWKASTGENRYRRAAYTYRWRNTPHPALKVFDAPDGLAACTRRIRSNTPLQALTLLNDPAFIELSMGLANRLLTEAATAEERIRLGFQLCLNREPDVDEVRLLTGLVAQQTKEFAAQASSAKAIVVHANALGQATRPVTGDAAFSAWTMVARVMLNLDETITRE